ncbi:MAG: M56 family metallopeptidase [Pirellulales bacterium]
MLWLLVLLKLVTPPLVDVPLPDFAMLDRSEPAPIVTEGDSSAPVLPPPPFEPYRGPVDNSWASDTTPSDIPASPATTAFDEPLPGGIETQDDRGVASAPPVERLVQRPAEHVADEQARAVDWPAVLLTAWLCGSVVCALVALVRIRRFRGVLAEARSADGSVLAICESAARQLGLKRLPRILIAEGNFTPLVWPVGRRSTVLLPRVLVGQLGDDELTTLVAHELAHLARRDHWVRWLELVCTVLYWWHPAVWWARRELSAAEDVCCDALVLTRFPDRARCYAEALVKAIEHAAARQSMPVLASGLGERQSLRRRITMVVHETLPRRMSWPARLAICALGVAVLSITLTAAPTDNESTADEPTDRADDVAATGEEIDASAADERTTKGDTAAATEPALAPDERNRPVKIKPGDQLQLHVLGTPDDPASKIWGDFRVEPSGTLPLGPSYGRVNVAGLTLEDAESVLRKFLGQILLEPQVQITWSFDESESTTNVPPAFESIGVLKAKLTRAKTAYDNTEKLYKQHVVSEATVVMAKAEYDIVRERLKQTEIEIKVRRAAAEVARAEYESALKANERNANAISATEIRRLRYEVQRAIAAVNVLAEGKLPDPFEEGGYVPAEKAAQPDEGSKVDERVESIGVLKARIEGAKAAYESALVLYQSARAA